MSLLNRLLSTLAAIALLTGCASPPPPIDYLVLTPPDLAPAASSLPVRLGRVGVPAYLDDSRIWVRTEAHALKPLPHARWAESLPEAITRNLRLQLGIGLAEAHDQPRLLIQIERLEARLDDDGGDRVDLLAVWQLLTGADSAGGPLREISLTQHLTGRDPNTIAAATAALLQQLGERLRSELETTQP